MALTDGLISAYNFDGNVLDVAGSNNLTASGSPSYTTGQIGQAISLNGSSQFASVADNSTLHFTTGFSVSIWLKRSSGGNNFCYGISKGDAASQIEWAVYTQGGNLYGTVYGLGNGSNSVVATDPGTGTWFNAILVFDGTQTGNSQLRLYLNGSAAANSFSPSMLPALGVLASAKPLTLGAVQNTSPSVVAWWPGLIDATQIWNRPLTAGEAALVYNSATGVQVPFATVIYQTVLSALFQGTVLPGEAAHQDVVTYVGAQNSYTAIMVDQNGNAVDESGDSYKFVASDLLGNYVFEETAMLGGTGNNQISWTIEPSHTTATMSLTYTLWNTTQTQPRFVGALEILPAVQPE